MRKIDKNYLNIHKKNENRKKVVKIKKIKMFYWSKTNKSYF